MFNAINLYVCKSTRKNAKIEMVDCRQFFEIDNEKAIEKIVDTTQKIIYTAKTLDAKQIIIDGNLSKQFDVAYQNANKQDYNTTDIRGIRLSQHIFCSIESLINFLYDCIMILNPSLTLSVKTLFENPSVKYTINQYYHGEE